MQITPSPALPQEGKGGTLLTMKIKILFLLVLSLLSIPVFAQEDYDDDPKPEGPTKYCYLPIDTIISGANTFTIRIYPGDIDEPGFKNDDTVLIYSVFQKQVDWCRESKFRIKKATLNTDEEDAIITLELYNNPKACKLIIGDLVACLQEDENKGKGLLLYRIDDFAIQLMDASREEMFPDGIRAYTVFDEWSYIQTLLKDLRATSPVLASRTAPFMTEGPFTGKTSSQILDIVTARDVIDFLHFMISYPGKYMGLQFKFNEIFMTWIKNKQIQGTMKDLKLVTEYPMLMKIKNLYFDIASGTVGGETISLPTSDYLSKFDFYNTKRKMDYLSCLSAVDWSTGANSLTYLPYQKCFQITQTHKALSDTSLFDKNEMEIKAKLGEPDQIIKAYRIAYRYKRSYGTLEMNFNTESYHPPRVTIIRMYSVSPENIPECK